MTYTAKEMLVFLERSLTPAVGWPKGCLGVEIEAPRPRVVRVRRGRTRSFKTGPRRRADAIWSPANSGQLHGYEIKVTRADLVTELRDPEKALAWSRMCNTWTLLVSDGSVLYGLEDEIPATWGIQTVPARREYRKLRTIRPAQEQVPVDQHLAFSRLIAWQAWKRWQEHELRQGHVVTEPDMDDIEEVA